MTLAFWQAGDYSAAARAARDWIRDESDRPAPYRYAARIYEDMGSLSQARRRRRARGRPRAARRDGLGAARPAAPAHVRPRGRARGARARARDRARASRACSTSRWSRTCGRRRRRGHAPASRRRSSRPSRRPRGRATRTRSPAPTASTDCLAACERALELGRRPRGPQPARARPAPGAARAHRSRLSAFRILLAPAMRLIVARCSVDYSGRLSARLPEALRLVMLKADGSVLVHADARRLQAAELDDAADGRSRRSDGRIVVRKLKGEDRLEIALAEVLHRRHARDGLRRRRAREGRRRGAPAGAARRRAGLVRRGLPARAARVADRHRPGRPDVPRRARTAGSRSRSSASGRSTPSSSSRATSSGSGSTRRWPTAAACSRRRSIKPQARVLAEARGIDWVEVDLAELRGEREPALTLFGMSAAVRAERRRRRPRRHDRPARGAQRRQPGGGRGDRRGARPARRRRRAARRRPHRRRRHVLRRHGPEGVRRRRAAVRRGPRLRRHRPAAAAQAADRRGRGLGAGRRLRDRARLRPDRRRPRRPLRHPRGQARPGRRRRRADPAAAADPLPPRHGARADRRPDRRRARARDRARQPARRAGRRARPPRASWRAAIAANGPLAVAATKRILEPPTGRAEALGAPGARSPSPVFASEDAREGATAFAEKRPPVWRGR